MFLSFFRKTDLIFLRILSSLSFLFLTLLLFLIISNLILFSVLFANFLIVKGLTPNYVIIAFELAKIPASIIEDEGANRLFILILTFFQIIFLNRLWLSK
jgi:hypothetical protein